MPGDRGRGGPQACLASTVDINLALRKYEQRRILRTSNVVLLSRRIGEMAQSKNPLLCSLRNLALRATPKSLAARHMTSSIEYEGLTETERGLLEG